MRWDHGGNGKSGSSSRVQLAGIHKAALNDYTISSTTVGLVWTWFNCQMYKMDVICNHKPASLSELFISLFASDLIKRANGTF